MRRSSRPQSKAPKYLKDYDEEKDDEDFVDSESDASLPDDVQSDESDISSADEFTKPTKSTPKNKIISHKKNKSIAFPKREFKKINIPDVVKDRITEVPFSVKDLTEEEKMLPDFLNLSESDSDDDCEDVISKNDIKCENNTLKNVSLDDICKSALVKSEPSFSKNNEKPDNYKSMSRLSGSDTDSEMEDVLPNQIVKNELRADSPISDKNIPKKLNFQQLHENSAKLEEAKKSLEMYKNRCSTSKENSFDVNALLAMGELEGRTAITENDQDMSDSDIEDLEEVQGESKVQPTIPKGGIQVTIDLPAGGSKQKKKLDLEMMVKRRINRVKKEYQVYMHKVHVLCWIAHGNFINKAINHEKIMARALSLIPSKHSYPENRVNIKYLEQIVKWYSETIVLEEDKNELKYKSNKLSLNIDLLNQISKKVASSKKNKVLIFVSMLRALGINCRLVISFQLVPIHPPTTELCSLSTKKVKNEDKNVSKHFKASTSKKQANDKNSKSEKVDKHKNSRKIPQLDGADDDLTSNSRRKSSRKVLNLSNSKKNANAPSKVKATNKEEQSSSSTLSYWDKITQDTIQAEPEERVSHKDLLKSRSTRLKTKRAETSAFFDNPDSQSSTKSVGKNKIDKPKTLATKVVKKKVAGKPKIVKSKEIIDAIKKSENVNTETLVKKTTRARASTSKSVGLENNSVSPKKLRSVNGKNQQSSKYFDDGSSVIKTNSKEKKKSLISPSTSKIEKKPPTVPLNREKKPNPIIKNKLKLPDVNSPNRKRRLSNASDADFKPVKRRTSVQKAGEIDRRVLSSDDENVSNDKKKRGVNIWCEVYVEEEEQWISVDIIKGEVHCTNQIYTRSNHPVSYIVSWDTSGYAKDVTRRYVPHWNTVTRRLRADPEWYSTALSPWKAPDNVRDRREDQELDRLQLDAPMPQTIFEFKNHPLYALKRHLLKFEVIYPPNSMVLGFVKNEAVYARECVHTCRSRETWVKEAKVVKPGEEPYKIVKARPKYDRSSGQMITDIPLEVFGPWQVDDYVPPRAEGGMVPRNPYGNVELFKPCMLPGGTVHLVLPGLSKVAKKLKIDCAPAMVGFDYHSGGSHPMYDGFVVCEEFKDELVAAWEQEQIEAEQRAREKIEKRVYGNWRKLIRGLFIRRKLQNKYDFQSLNFENEPTSSTSNKRSKYSDKANKKSKNSDDASDSE